MNQKEQKIVYETLGNEIRLLRIQLDLNQEELAHMIGKSRATIANIERGTQQPTLHLIIDLSRVLQINLLEKIANFIDLPEKGLKKNTLRRSVLKMSKTHNLENPEGLIDFLKKL